MAIAWDRATGDTFVKTAELNSYRQTVGAAPLCGHAVDSANGITRVFMTAWDTRKNRADDAEVISSGLPTGETQGMADFMLSSAPVQPHVVSQDGLFFKMLIGYEDNFDQGHERTVSVWLGDHRSIILVEGRTGAIYNAETNALEQGPVRVQFWDWFLAGIATQEHVDYLGCEEEDVDG